MSGNHAKQLRVIGSDDWLVFARDSNNKLFSTCVEVHPSWIDMPHRGGYDQRFQPVDDYPGSEREKEDWRWMLDLIAEDPDKFSWSQVERGLDAWTDDGIAQRTFEEFGWNTSAPFNTARALKQLQRAPGQLDWKPVVRAIAVHLGSDPEAGLRIVDVAKEAYGEADQMACYNVARALRDLSYGDGPLRDRAVLSSAGLSSQQIWEIHGALRDRVSDETFEAFERSIEVQYFLLPDSGDETREKAPRSVSPARSLGLQPNPEVSRSGGLGL